MNNNKILVIEDDSEIREIVKLAIEMEGHEVITAANGQEGLDILAKEQPCLILLDLMMPVMDGWTFAEKVGQNDHLKFIPIVIVSAYSDKAKLVKNSKGFINKPIDLDVLLEQITQYCGKGSQA